MKNGSRISYKFIEKLVKERGFKNSEVYKHLGVSRQTFHQFKAVDIPLNHLEKLSELFNVDSSVLLLGSEESNINNDGDINIKAHEQKEEINNEDEAHTYLKLSRAFFAKDIKTENLRALKIKREDMIPDISPDDWLIYEKKVGIFKGNGVYVFCFSNRYVVRKVSHHEITNKFHLSTHSTNSEDILSLEDIQKHLLGKRIAQLHF